MTSLNPAQKRSLLTLTTDFGTRDGYVGAVKGRILSLAPHVKLVDISHQIEPQSILQGAWCLKRALSTFPENSVHLAVIDPGVGSNREGLIVVTERFLLLGPDNGVLFLAAQQGGLREIFAIREHPPEIVRSTTFDGLSLFAPAAAQLMNGAAPKELGDPITNMKPLDWPRAIAEGIGMQGEILFFDHFGNALTNLEAEHWAAESLGESASQSADKHADKSPWEAPERMNVKKITVETGGNKRIELRLATHYQQLEAFPQGAGALWNSDGMLELALASGSMREKFGLAPGMSVRIE